MPNLPPMLRLADLLLLSASLLRALSTTSLQKGSASHESKLAARIEGIAAEVAALSRRQH